MFPQKGLHPHRKQPAKCIFGNSLLPQKRNQTAKPTNLSLYQEFSKGLGGQPVAKSREFLFDSPRALWRRRASVHALRSCCPREETLFGELPRKGGRDFLVWSPRKGANEFEGQCKGWGLTGRFPWHPGRGGGMYPASCGETTGLPGQPGWRGREGGRTGWGWGEAGRDGGRAVTCALGGEAPSPPGSEPSPAKWLRKKRTLTGTEGLNVARTPWEDSSHRRPGAG